MQDPKFIHSTSGAAYRRKRNHCSKENIGEHLKNDDTSPQFDTQKLLQSGKSGTASPFNITPQPLYSYGSDSKTPKAQVGAFVAVVNSKKVESSAKRQFGEMTGLNNIPSFVKTFDENQEENTSYDVFQKILGKSNSSAIIEQKESPMSRAMKHIGSFKN